MGRAWPAKGKGSAKAVCSLAKRRTKYEPEEEDEDEGDEVNGVVMSCNAVSIYSSASPVISFA